MTTQWYYAKNGQSLGPFSSSQLRQLAASGVLQPTDMVLKQGTDRWLVASSIRGLDFPQAVVPRPMPRPNSDYAEVEVVCSANPLKSTPAHDVRGPDLPTGPPKIPSGEYTSYEQVPWYRRSGTNSWFVVLGFFCFTPLLWMTCLMLLTGDVYYNKVGANGFLKRWSFLNKIVAAGLLFANAYFLYSAFIGAIWAEVQNQPTETRSFYPPQPAPPKLGTLIQYHNGKSQLYYTSAVTEAEARKLGDYLLKEAFFQGEREVTTQLNKTGKIFEFRMVIKKGLDQDPEYIGVAKQMAKQLSLEVFEGAIVEIHLCDENMKTIRVVLPLR